MCQFQLDDQKNSGISKALHMFIANSFYAFPTGFFSPRDMNPLHQKWAQPSSVNFSSPSSRKWNLQIKHHKASLFFLNILKAAPHQLKAACWQRWNQESGIWNEEITWWFYQRSVSTCQKLPNEASPHVQWKNLANRFETGRFPKKKQGILFEF